MKRICKEQYEKDFDEMFKLDKKGLMTDIDCYVSNLENSIKRLEEENQELKNQLETLEETNNQLISKLDRYDAIVDERDELKKQLEVGEEQYNDLVEEKEKLQEQLSGTTLQLEEYKHKGLYNTCLPYSTGYKKAIKEKENQQKEFIDYMNKIIEDCNNYSKYIEKKLQELKSRSVGKTFIANEIMKNEVSKKILKEILSKYQEIIEVKNER